MTTYDGSNKAVNKNDICNKINLMSSEDTNEILDKVYIIQL